MKSGDLYIFWFCNEIKFIVKVIYVYYFDYRWWVGIEGIGGEVGGF